MAENKELPVAIPTKAVIPLLTFPDHDVFVSRHEQGTIIEMRNETAVLKQLNDRRNLYSGWPIAPIPELTTAFTNTWLLLVERPKGETMHFPSIGDRFTIDLASPVEIEQGKFSLIQLHTSLIQNPYEESPDPDVSRLKDYATLRVDVPRSWQTDDDNKLELDLMANLQIAQSIEMVGNIELGDRNCQKFTIHWESSTMTFEAELAALRFFTEEHRLPGRGPSFKSKAAFQTILNFHEGWKTFYNLHEMFPHLVNPSHPHHRLPKKLLEKFQDFTDDHRAAFDGLAQIPNGLYFVNGCPGAGKTEWNMIVSGLLQSKRRPRSKRRHSPILFLVDINQAVDDAADRYFNLCKEVGLKLRIIRMHGWPYEMRHSETMNGASRSGKPVCSDSDGGDLDFTKRFLATAALARVDQSQRGRSKAPTLDEASWDYYQKHKGDAFVSLDKILQRMGNGEVLGTSEWKALRSLVAMLYRAVLAQTDFVATTPAAASGSFSKLFRPDIVFFDEAPHARELTTLIAIAYYDPVA